MWIVKVLLSALFLPGNIVLKSLGVSVEENSGILRSFVSSCFWGSVVLIVVLT